MASPAFPLLPCMWFEIRRGLYRGESRRSISEALLGPGIRNSRPGRGLRRFWRLRMEGRGSKRRGLDRGYSRRAGCRPNHFLRRRSRSYNLVGRYKELLVGGLWGRETYKRDCIGLRSVPRTVADGYCCAVTNERMESLNLQRKITKFYSPDTSTSCNIKDVLGISEGSQV